MSIAGSTYTSNCDTSDGWTLYNLDCTTNSITCTIYNPNYNNGDRLYITRFDTNNSNTCTISSSVNINGQSSLTLPIRTAGSNASSIMLYMINNEWLLL